MKKHRVTLCENKKKLEIDLDCFLESPEQLLELAYVAQVAYAVARVKAAYILDCRKHLRQIDDDELRSLMAEAQQRIMKQINWSL